MTFTDAHKRQIAQFMVIVQHYLDLASPAKAEREETLGMTKDSYLPGATATESTRQLTIIGAHLSSAAIRLASIEDVLKNAKVANRSYLECRAYFDGQGDLSDSEAWARMPKWFHVMLRDNAAHEEPPVAPEGKKARRRRARQTYIENTTFADAYTMVHAIATELFEVLRARHEVVPPTFH